MGVAVPIAAACAALLASYFGGISSAHQAPAPRLHFLHVAPLLGFLTQRVAAGLLAPGQWTLATLGSDWHAPLGPSVSGV